MSFGERLKHARQEMGISQQGLADRSGVPIGTLRDYEQGKRDPMLSNAAALAKALHVTLDSLAGLTAEHAGGSAATGQGDEHPEPKAQAGSSGKAADKKGVKG